MVNIKKFAKRLIPVKLFQVIEPYGHLLEAVAANIRYGFPSRKMRVIGITGTNGKTTTTNIIYKMLLGAGYKVGMMSTVSYAIGDKEYGQTHHMTTESAWVLQKRLKQFKEAGVGWLVLETSSHALAQNRVWGVPFEIAVMTNITHEHLDYHKTFDRYLEAKCKLFCLANKRKNGFGVINSDDPNFDRFSASIKQSIGYGLSSGELRAKNIKLTSGHSEYTAVVGSESLNIRINLPGAFNVSNSLAALAVGRHLGLSKGQIESGIRLLEKVDGRMESIKAGQKYSVIVDFACTPDAFEQVLSSLRPKTKGRLIVLFGSPAHRDEAKRPMQGEIAAKYADEVILTEDDIRDEDINSNLEQIAVGAKKIGKKIGKDLFLVPDREKAIELAISHVIGSKDTVALLGKGHEVTITRANGDEPWDDAEIVKKYIKQCLKKK